MTLHEVVARERREVLRRTVVRGAALGAAVTLGLLLAGAVLLGGTRWVTLPRALPFALWALVLSVNLLLGRWAWRRARRTTILAMAEAIEREQQLRSGAVRGALQVGTQGALGRRASDAVSTDLAARGAVLAPALRRQETRHASLAVAVAVMAAVAAGAVAPAFGDGLQAVLHPADAYSGALLPPLSLREVPDEVLRGEPVRVRVLAGGRRMLTLEVRGVGEGWRRLQVPVRAGLAEVELGAMRGTLHLVASDGRSVSDTAVIVAVDRPSVGGVTIRALHLPYLGRPAETLDPTGELRVPRGTALEITGRASLPLRRVLLAGARDSVELTAEGQRFAGRLLPAASGAWRWVAEAGADARPLDVPEPLAIVVLPDSAPVADLLTPRTDTALAPGQQLPLHVAAADDHGLGAVLLETRVLRDGRAEEPRRQLVASPPDKLWDGRVVLRTADLGARDGDVVAVRVIAVDASPWAQTGASRELRIRLMTSEQRRERARDVADSAVAAAQAAARAQRALAERTEQAARTRDRTTASGEQRAQSAAGAMTHDAAERARTIAREQRQLAERVTQVREAAQQAERSLGEAGALDSSLARQLRDVQELLRQALSPELLAQMQRLEQSAQELGGEQARQALQDLATMQQRLREQLDQSAELLRRAAAEGAMQTLGDEARELAQRERALADSAARGQTDGTREARDLADRTRRYADDVRALQERLARERASAGAEGTSEARRAAQRAEERLRQAAGAPPAPAAARSPRPSEQRAGAPQQVADAARSAAAQMEQAAAAMESAREAQVREWKQELTQELDRAVQEMLQLAREESALEQQARANRAGADRMRGRQSAVQQGVDQTRQRLQEAGRRSSLLSGGAQRAVADAREKVQAATRELSQRDEGAGRQQAADALAEAAEALNRAAAALARDRERAGSASSASGFAEMMRQLQQMAQRQGAINAQAQSILQIPGAQQSPQAAQIARALARQQRQVAQGLDDIGEEAGGGRTGELAREARQLAEALDAGRLDARTAARQEQLFRRLLDAGRSLEKEEREDTDRREARAATGSEVHTPSGTSERGREARRFREPTWEELRGLSADERRAIIEYFRRINASGTP